MSIEFEAMYRAALSAAKERAQRTVGDPYCGFAWVTLKPATSAFARYCKAKGYARSGTYGGLEFSIYPALEGTQHAHTQSMTVKEEAAYEFADVLRGYGLNAYAHSRAD